MRNTKVEMAAYREAVRHLWNSTFSTLDDSLRFGICLDLFEQIDSFVFRALVCEPLGIEFGAKASVDPINSLSVIPSSPSDVPIMINRSIPASGYWDDPVKVIRASDVDLVFIGFFDWEAYNQKDMRYYRVRILDCISQPSLAGRDALIETFYAEVFLNDAVSEAEHK
jgi:hypothetical protein